MKQDKVFKTLSFLQSYYVREPKEIWDGPGENLKNWVFYVDNMSLMGQKDRQQTDIVTTWAPDGAQKNWYTVQSQDFLPM